MITPTAVDFDADGDLDIVCGDEDGRVAFIEHTSKVVGGMPQFLRRATSGSSPPTSSSARSPRRMRMTGTATATTI